MVGRKIKEQRNKVDEISSSLKHAREMFAE
jgi:hypothetical protein